MRPVKREYTDTERKKILKFIIDNKGFYSLRGNAFWKKMEKEKVLQRTWQSMKEHFRMKIVNNLILYDISKENQKKIIAGYNNTKTVDKTDNQTIHVPQYNNLDFSDEEKETEKRRCLSTSSDDSDNLVIDIDKNKPSTSKKGFKKQSFKRRSTRKIISDTEESTSNNNINTPSIIKETECLKDKELETINEIVSVDDAKQSNNLEQNDTIEIVATSPSIPDRDVNSDDSASINVSSTNLDATCVEFSIAEDKKFLQAITKYHSNLLNCASIVTFIKQYTDQYGICSEWTDLYDRFIEILNNLQLYDFLAPEIVMKLQNLKDPLEKYRSDGFQEAKLEILPVKLANETFKFTLAPEPDLIYLKKESLDLVSFLDKIRTTIYELVEKAGAGAVSQETVLDIIKKLTEFNAKYVPQRSVHNNDQNCDSAQNVQIVKQEVENDDYPEIRIKEENMSMNIVEREMVSNNVALKQETVSIETSENDSQSNLSDTISIQPEISLNLAEVQDNSIQSSQYLESLTTEELNVTNIVGKIIENDSNQSDHEFLTCESNL